MPKEESFEPDAVILYVDPHRGFANAAEAAEYKERGVEGDKNIIHKLLTFKYEGHSLHLVRISVANNRNDCNVCDLFFYVADDKTNREASLRSYSLCSKRAYEKFFEKRFCVDVLGVASFADGYKPNGKAHTIFNGIFESASVLSIKDVHLDGNKHFYETFEGWGADDEDSFQEYRYMLRLRLVSSLYLLKKIWSPLAISSWDRNLQSFSHIAILEKLFEETGGRVKFKESSVQSLLGFKHDFAFCPPCMSAYDFLVMTAESYGFYFFSDTNDLVNFRPYGSSDERKKAFKFSWNPDSKFTKGDAQDLEMVYGMADGAPLVNDVNVLYHGAHQSLYLNQSNAVSGLSDISYFNKSYDFKNKNKRIDRRVSIYAGTSKSYASVAAKVFLEHEVEWQGTIEIALRDPLKVDNAGGRKPSTLHDAIDAFCKFADNGNALEVYSSVFPEVKELFRPMSICLEVGEGVKPGNGTGIVSITASKVPYAAAFPGAEGERNFERPNLLRSQD